MLTAKFESGHAMDFQSQHFPDKGFHEHPRFLPLVGFAQQRRVADSGCFSFHIVSSELVDLPALNPSVFGEEPQNLRSV
jgi:hypothetical protein